MEKSMICPKCGVVKFDELDLENIEENGECMVCDHMRTDNDDDDDFFDRQ